MDPMNWLLVLQFLKTWVNSYRIQLLMNSLLLFLILQIPGRNTSHLSWKSFSGTAAKNSGLDCPREKQQTGWVQSEPRGRVLSAACSQPPAAWATVVQPRRGKPECQKPARATLQPTGDANGNFEIYPSWAGAIVLKQQKSCLPS